MREHGRSLKIMVVEDEEDILLLYRDFLSHRGHEVVSKDTNIETIMAYLEEETPDLFIIDHVLGGKKEGIEIATKILKKVPSAPILFITGYELLLDTIRRVPSFYDRNVRVLIKPVKLDKIEDTIMNMIG